MSADDDTELRDLVIDSLEKKGVLGKIKAELRATVFLALEENEKDPSNGNHLHGSQSQQELNRFLATQDGILALSLVRDFLQQLQLDFTLSVLDPEVSSGQKSIPRNELSSLLNLSPDSDNFCPLLSLLLLSRAQNTSVNNRCDLNGNVGKVNKKPYSENGLERRNLKSDLLNETTKVDKISNELKSREHSPRGLLGDDSFFDDPLPANKNNSLFYNYLDIPLVSKSEPEIVESHPPVVSNVSSEAAKVKSEVKLDRGLDSSDEKKSGLGLTSLKDLPSLDPVKPKEGRKQWKDTEPEARERFMNLTFGNNRDFADGLLSPLSTGGDVDGNDNSEKDQSDPPDLEGSIEENIEEDIFSGVDDLLASTASSKEENVTVDKSVSGFSKAGGFDYMENLT